MKKDVEKESERIPKIILLLPYFSKDLQCIAVPSSLVRRQVNVPLAFQ